MIYTQKTYIDAKPTSTMPLMFIYFKLELDCLTCTHRLHSSFVTCQLTLQPNHTLLFISYSLLVSNIRHMGLKRPIKDSNLAHWAA